MKFPKQSPTVKHNAIAKCFCGKLIHSAGGGKFVVCEECGGFIDQERWSGRYVRTGNAEFLEQICPENCEHREDGHKNNKIIETYGELVDYLKNTYKIII